MYSQPPISALERFARHFTIAPSGCWVFDSLNVYGYGQFGLNNRVYRAHRWLYQVIHNRALTKEQLCDHLCRNRACVNPRHIEIVNSQTNIHRGYGTAGVNARKTHCKRGHELTPENTRLNTSGGRVCKVCDRARLTKRRIKGEVNGMEETLRGLGIHTAAQDS